VDQLESDFRFLVAASRRLLRVLRDQLHLASPGISKRGHQFEAVLSVLLDALDREIDRREQRFASADDVDRESLVRQLRQLHAHAEIIHEDATPWANAIASADPLDLGLTYFLDEATDALVKEDADVVIVPDAEYGYAAFHRRFNKLAQELGATYPTGAHPIALYFPAKESSTVLLNTLLVHELAHSAVASHGLKELVRDTNPNPNELDDFLAAATAEYAQLHGLSAIDAQIDVDDFADRWLEELLCDALSVAYLGPTYVFAFVVMAFAATSNEPDADHPSTALRVRLMIQELERMDWMSLLEAELPEVSGWLRELGQAPSDPDAGYPAKLDDAMQLLSSTVEAVALRHLGPATFSRSGYDHEARLLTDLFENWILPAQLPSDLAPDRRALVQSALFSLVLQHGDRPDSLPLACGDGQRQNFISKALEMSIVLDKWKQLS
jgi:hypothetical protein